MSESSVISQSPDMDCLEPPTFDHKSSFVRRAALFSNDQEIFIDASSPLILVCDSNLASPNIRNIGHLPQINIKKIKDNNITDNGNSVIDANSKARLSLFSSYGEETLGLKLNQTFDSQSSKKPKNSFDSQKKTNEQETESMNLFEENRKPKERNILRARLTRLLDKPSFNYMMALFIIYALFSDDFRTIVFGPSVDLGFDITSLIIMGIFILEIIITLFVKEDYLWSFFFWLDLVSTISILFDVQMISNDVFPTGAANTAQLARASRASRIGARAGRVVRIFRLVRLAKLYKQINEKQKGKEFQLQRVKAFGKIHPEQEGRANIPFSLVFSTPDLDRIKRIGAKSQQNLAYSRDLSDPVKMPLPKNGYAQDLEEETLKESRVGKKLSDLTTKRVIVIVLALLMLIPLFSSDFFFDTPASHDYEVSLLNDILNNPSISSQAKQVAIDTYAAQESANDPSLIFLQVGDTLVFPDYNQDTSNLEVPSSLRDDEKDTVVYAQTSVGDIVSIVNLRSKKVLQSGLNIARTFFVCIILVLGSLLFSKDANNLILRPIERMIEKVSKIARDPLIAKEQRLVKDRNAGLENETVQIENAIIKIGSLLALGFGDAGSAIVAQNIARTGDLNPMLPGKKEMAIFGFCDIRNFTDTTEILQQEVMVFVNSIADIVHSMVDMYTGAANKNIGDAFLLVWKLPNSEAAENDEMPLEVKTSKIVQAMADMALISFIKINIKINRDAALLEYRSDPALLERLPNFKVKMGFGLHVGWAIEGAIGSEFKIDASYLSPNVNLASRLEAATKQYGVPLLFSGELYQKLSKVMKQKARLIDVVTVKGSLLPMEIYTVDMDVNDMAPSHDRRLLSVDQKREVQRMKKKLLYEEITQKGTAHILDKDWELIHAFRFHDQEFKMTFGEGFDAYIQGDWSKAKKLFEECLELQKDDGPTRNLLDFLKEHDYIAPEDWKGYHVLTEK